MIFKDVIVWKVWFGQLSMSQKTDMHGFTGRLAARRSTSWAQWLRQCSDSADRPALTTWACLKWRQEETSKPLSWKGCLLATGVTASQRDLKAWVATAYFETCKEICLWLGSFSSFKSWLQAQGESRQLGSAKTQDWAQIPAPTLALTVPALGWQWPDPLSTQRASTHFWRHN